MKKINYPSVLTIAGTDPSGGAGIQADIKAISATGSYAASVITALVAQNTQGVQAMADVSAAFVTQQLQSVFSDLAIQAVKIGMLHNEAVIQVVADALQQYQPPNIVLDPVMVAKSGCELLPLSIVETLKTTLFPHVHLITPNLFEAEKLVNKPIHTQVEMAETAKQLGDQHHVNVLLKGGHLHTDDSSDVLYEHTTQSLHWFHAKRVISSNTHGTGCSLSSAIASYLAQQYSLRDAIQLAKNYLTNAIRYGSTHRIGKGNGPVHHFYFLEENTYEHCTLPSSA